MKTCVNPIYKSKDLDDAMDKLYRHFNRIKIYQVNIFNNHQEALKKLREKKVIDIMERIEGFRVEMESWKLANLLRGDNPNFQYIHPKRAEGWRVSWKTFQNERDIYITQGDELCGKSFKIQEIFSQDEMDEIFN